MSSLFNSDPPPQAQEDPEAARLREEERQRAEAARTTATQEQLRQETLFRSRRFGTRSLLGSFGSGSSLLGSG